MTMQPSDALYAVALIDWVRSRCWCMGIPGCDVSARRLEKPDRYRVLRVRLQGPPFPDQVPHKPLFDGRYMVLFG